MCHPSNSDSVPRPGPKAACLRFLNRKCIPGPPGISVGQWVDGEAEETHKSVHHRFPGKSCILPSSSLSSWFWCCCRVCPSTVCFILGFQRHLPKQNHKIATEWTGWPGCYDLQCQSEFKCPFFYLQLTLHTEREGGRERDRDWETQRDRQRDFCDSKPFCFLKLKLHSMHVIFQDMYSESWPCS